MNLRASILAAFSFSISIFSLPAFGAAPPPGLVPPSGYELEVFANDIPGARSLARGTLGTIFVGTRGDRVYAFRDGKRFTVAQGLNQPNGVAFRDGSLYVAEIHRVIRFDAIESKLTKPPKPVVVYDQLPRDKHHGWKFIAFGPDGALYVPVGAPCNVCDKSATDARYASILRFPDLKGGAPEVYASGIRNTVGFAWHPETQDLWFTENGRDNLGDDVPGDELNVAPRKGMHFGFPYCHEGRILDPEFGKNRACSDFVLPQALLGAHVAALGMRFLDARTILIAEHGSWNRSSPVGYQVVKVTLQGTLPPKIVPFLTGFLGADEKVTGRPVDVEILPDGSILVSDDYVGRIYRLKPKAGNGS